MRILTIDDEQDILDILSDCLVSLGHEVVQATRRKTRISAADSKRSI